MRTSLDERIAVVTGASRGIGRSIALAFAREGAAVVVTGRTTGELETLAAEVESLGGTALAVTADLAAPCDVDRIAEEALEHFGRIDILVNNAGIVAEPAELVDFDPDLWRRVIEVNLIAPAMLTRAVLPAMIEQGWGRVINISSIGGRRGGPRQTAYKATKAALINLTESVAAEVRKHGIDVNCICPGGVDTPGIRYAFGDNVTSELPTMPPDAIADVALFLVSPAARSLTGAVLDAFGDSSPIFQPPVRLQEPLATAE
jgi:NAD(P)-dependent dehydrogenase (short-subunit alcohol dehydrogenase family)